LIWFYDKN